jgi:hypothetical protein
VSSLFQRTAAAQTLDEEAQTLIFSFSNIVAPRMSLATCGITVPEHTRARSRPSTLVAMILRD